MSPTWQHRLEHGALRAMQAAVLALPQSAAERVGAAAGAAAYAPFGIRREVAEDNLRRAFPDATEEWIGETARAAFAHLGREGAAILRLAEMGPAEIVARTEVRRWDELMAARERGRGVILATGHFGNWEVAAAAVAARGVPLAAVVRRLRHRLVDARLEEMRRRLGIRTVEARDAPRAIPRLLRRGWVVGMLADQDARGAGVFVPFFGRPASTHRGPALFALRLGAALFACSARRLPGPGPRWEVIGDPVPVEPTGDVEADTVQLTAALTSRLERTIRSAPEQYFWFHRRWKTAPPKELLSAATGTIPDFTTDELGGEKT
ncbi:lysophospholipid acyltransferase family protein [soil metagenome]